MKAEIYKLLNALRSKFYGDTRLHFEATPYGIDLVYKKQYPHFIREQVEEMVHEVLPTNWDVKIDYDQYLHIWIRPKSY